VDVVVLGSLEAFLANRHWPVGVRVCAKLTSAMQSIKLLGGKWLGKRTEMSTMRLRRL
jgi:hypothetical protein